MIFMPVDLFGSYLQGKRQAINDNWSDLKNYGSVENQYLQNDNQQLRNWFAQDTYGDNLSLSNSRARQGENAATQSDYQTQLAGAAQPGALARTATQSNLDVNYADQLNPRIPGIAANTARTTENNVTIRGINSDFNAAHAQDVVQQNYDVGTSANNSTATVNNYNAAHYADQQEQNNELRRAQAEAQQRALYERIRQNDLTARSNWAALHPGVPYPDDQLAPASAQPLTPQQTNSTPGAQPAAQDTQAQLDAIPNGRSATVNGVTYYRDNSGRLHGGGQ